MGQMVWGDAMYICRWCGREYRYLAEDCGNCCSAKCFDEYCGSDIAHADILRELKKRAAEEKRRNEAANIGCWEGCGCGLLWNVLLISIGIYLIGVVIGILFFPGFAKNVQGVAKEVLSNGSFVNKTQNERSSEGKMTWRDSRKVPIGNVLNQKSDNHYCRYCGKNHPRPMGVLVTVPRSPICTHG